MFDCPDGCRKYLSRVDALHAVILIVDNSVGRELEILGNKPYFSGIGARVEPVPVYVDVSDDLCALVQGHWFDAAFFSFIRNREHLLTTYPSLHVELELWSLYNLAVFDESDPKTGSHQKTVITGRLVCDFADGVDVEVASIIIDVIYGQDHGLNNPVIFLCDRASAVAMARSFMAG